MLVALLVIFAVFAAAILAAGSWVLSVAATAPACNQFRANEQPQSSAIFAGDGSRLGYIQSDTPRQVVPRKKIPTSLKYATVATPRASSAPR